MCLPCGWCCWIIGLAVNSVGLWIATTVEDDSVRVGLLTAFSFPLAGAACATFGDILRFFSCVGWGCTLQGASLLLVVGGVVKAGWSVAYFLWANAAYTAAPAHRWDHGLPTRDGLEALHEVGHAGVLFAIGCFLFVGGLLDAWAGAEAWNATERARGKSKRGRKRVITVEP